jgi:hypothetical protein
LFNNLAKFDFFFLFFFSFPSLHFPPCIVHKKSRTSSFSITS